LEREAAYVTICLSDSLSSGRRRARWGRAQKRRDREGGDIHGKIKQKEDFSPLNSLFNELLVLVVVLV